MDFALDTAQTQLIDTARAYFRGRGGEGSPATSWREMADLGWTGLLVPEEHGGVAATFLDAILLVEQFGYASVAGPFISSAVAATVVLADAGHEDRLADMAAGNHIVTLAVSEISGEFTADSVTLSATRNLLSGHKRFVKDADVAHELIVATRTTDGIGCYLIPRAETTITPIHTISGETVFQLTFDAVPTSAERLLGGRGDGWTVMQRGIAAGTLARAAEMVGLAQRVVDVVVAYAKVREQGGQPIGAFQAIQHHCADMLRDLEGARYITYRAASDMDQTGGPGAAVAMAKAYASEKCLALVRRAHQVLGAIGYCDEHELHVLHKRIHAAAVDFGDAPAHLDSIADELGLV